MDRATIKQAMLGIGREMVGTSALLRASVGTAAAVAVVWGLGWSWWVLAVLVLSYVAVALLRRVFRLEDELERTRRAVEKGVGPNVSVQLSDAASAVNPILMTNAALDEWVLLEEKRLRRPLSDDPIHEAIAAVKWQNILGRMEPENRTPDEYDDQVGVYLEEAREALPRWLHADAVRARLGEVTVVAEHLSDDNCEAVVIELFVPGQVWAYVDEFEALEEAEFPGAPRPWGPRRIGGIKFPDYRLPTPLHLGRRGPQITNSESAQITFDEVDLRPRRRVTVGTIHLVVAHAAAAELTATWTATARSHSGEANGELTIPLGEPVAPVELEQRARDETD